MCVSCVCALGRQPTQTDRGWRRPRGDFGVIKLKAAGWKLGSDQRNSESQTSPSLDGVRRNLLGGFSVMVAAADQIAGSDEDAAVSK